MFSLVLGQELLSPESLPAQWISLTSDLLKRPCLDSVSKHNPIHIAAQLGNPETGLRDRQWFLLTVAGCSS